MAFAFRRPQLARSASVPLVQAVTVPAGVKAAAPLPKVAATDPAPAELFPDASLDDARRLADEGQFDDAIALCDAHLGVHGPSAPAFCLLGAVHDAAGRADEAESCYRKALYLEPRDEEAVTQLALLVERRGAADEAKVLWSRARRLAGRGGR
jgi:chemotaxis protein methyltransferase WspC